MYEPKSLVEDTSQASRASGGQPRQRTLKSAINCTGIGLHSGKNVTMTLRPAAPDTGIVFRRIDLAGGGAEIPAHWSRVNDTRLCTCVANSEGVAVRTIEHLMAALAGQRIDNLKIDINGPEVPIMDGSAAPFVFLIDCAGVVEQDRPRKAIKILKTITVEDGGRVATLTPDSGFAIDFAIDFANEAIRRQELSVQLAGPRFKAEIARARTFGFEHEVIALRAAGLAKGGSLDNAVVVGVDNTILNEDGLRYDDEFVRHKVLDAVGDLYLAGYPILGRFQAHCSGHAMNNRVLAALFADPDAWCLVPASESAAQPAPAVMAPARRAIA